MVKTAKAQPVPPLTLEQATSRIAALEMESERRGREIVTLRNAATQERDRFRELQEVAERNIQVRNEYQRLAENDAREARKEAAQHRLNAQAAAQVLQGAMTLLQSSSVTQAINSLTIKHPDSVSGFGPR